MAKTTTEKITNLAAKLEALVAKATDEELDSYDIPMWLQDSLVAMEKSDRDAS